MSSGTVATLSPTPETPIAPPTECELVVQRRIEETGRNVKGVDIAGGLVTLAIVILGYLLAAAAIDHWLVVGGLGFWGRLWLWLVLVGAAGTYFALRLLPPLLNRINPLFAAATIERSQPSLKNSLINFLLLRGRYHEVAPIVYQAMERRAAADLAGVEMDVAVDRTHVIRLGYVLLAVVLAFGLYLVISPKSPIRSAARVLWPWSSVEAPTRVTIRDVQPGDTVALRDDFVTVSAEVAGLRDGESASVIFSTADGQTIDQAAALARPEGEYRYQCRLPPDSAGLQQDLIYHLAAGDCQTGRYRIEAQIAPAIVVDKVSYHYPAYTGLADRTVPRQGDLQAIEGTEVTIFATANTEIKPGTAEIDLGCTGQRGVRMTADGRTAVGHLTLRLSPKDPTSPEYDSYQLRFADLQGRENPHPIRHRVEVIRDLPPEVELVEPKKEQGEVQVAADGKLAIKVRAKDPDFALRRVTLRAQHDDKSLPIAPLLDRRKPERAWPGEFSAVYTFEPERLRLKAGDRVEYWAEAEDDKEPASNQAASARQQIVVVGPEKPKAAAGDRPGEGTSGDRGGEKGQTGENGQAGEKGQTGDNAKADDKAAADGRAESPADKKSQPGEGQPDQKQTGSSEQSQAGQKSGSSQSGQGTGKQGAQAAEKSTDRVDPDANPGDAMQKILDERQKSDQKRQADKQAGGEKPGESTSAGEKAGGEKAGGEKAGGEKAGGEKTGGEKTGGEKAGGEKAGGEKAGGEKAGGEKAGGEKAGGEKAGGEKAGGEKAGGEKAGGEKAGTEKGKAAKSEGEKAGAEKGGGQQDADQQPPGQQPGGEGAPKEKPGADTAGGEKSGSATGGKESKQPGGEQSADQKKSGEKQPGEQSSPGAGKNVGNDAGSPAPQNDNQARQKKPDKAGEAPGERKGDMAQSPSTSNKQSDSQGETAGDRSGGGEQGGGQQSNQPGVGGPGKHTPADEGGSQAAESGEGKVGNKPGDKAVAKKSTGEGPQQKVATGGRAGEPAGGKPSGDGAGGKSPREAASGNQGGSSNPTIGGGANGPGTKSDAAASPPEAVESPADEANLEYARRQSELALEYLRDQLAKEKPAVLEKLGWTKEDARQFLDHWEEMRRAAVEKGPAGESARKQLEDALRSLGLRPRGTELRHGGLQVEQPQNLRDAGRFAPPPDWAEQLREYTRGVAGGERKGGGQ